MSWNWAYQNERERYLCDSAPRTILSRRKGLTRSAVSRNNSMSFRLYLFVFSDNFPHLTDDLVENNRWEAWAFLQMSIDFTSTPRYDTHQCVTTSSLTHTTLVCIVTWRHIIYNIHQQNKNSPHLHDLRWLHARVTGIHLDIQINVVRVRARARVRVRVRVRKDEDSTVEPFAKIKLGKKWKTKTDLSTLSRPPSIYFSWTTCRHCTLL